jgi:hypothetical protein
VLIRRRQIAGLLNSGSWLRSQTGRVLSGLALGVTSPHVADAARKGERRAENQDRKNDDAGNKRDTSEESKQSETESDQRNSNKSSAESRDAGANSDNSGKHVRHESTNGSDGGRRQGATDSEKTRSDSGRNADSDSDSGKTSAEDDDSHHHGGRHLFGFEQRADELTRDSPTNDSSHAASATPANPNVVIDHVSDASIDDLVAQANDHVVAKVSSSGGFAFARSGDVIAFSGPDGVSIAKSGDVIAGTSGTSPAEPSDRGGNNDIEFSS